MNEIFREIQEDIQRERMEKLWKKFGKLMVAASVLIVATTAVVIALKNHRESVAMEATSQLIKGFDRLALEDYKGALASFDAFTQDESSPYYGIALLRKAQVLKKMNDAVAANNAYEKLAAHKDAFAGLAKMNVADPAHTVQPDPASPFYFSEREWRAWQWLEAGKKEDAVKEFLALYKEQSAPSSQRGRMAGVLAYLAPESMASDEQVEK